MIDEAELSELLTAAATTFEVPKGGEDAVLAAATAPADSKRERPHWRPRRPRLAVGLAAGVLVVGGIFALGTVVGSQQHKSKFSPVGLPVTGASAGTSAGPSGASAGFAGTASGATAAQPAPVAAPAVRGFPQRRPRPR
ncbi:MAG: hypothetical protein JWP02_1380, partial [Acidimicrobiales bacterium]|nr:hypothetical protein [Acidimicrobiales bacterium]